MIEIAFTENKLDQVSMSKAGGYIVIKADGNPVFRFETMEQFNKYMELKQNGGKEQ